MKKTPITLNNIMPNVPPLVREINRSWEESLAEKKAGWRMVRKDKKMISSHLRYSEEEFRNQAIELYELIISDHLSNNSVTFIIDMLKDAYNDGRKYGQAKAIEDMGHDIQGVLSEFEDYNGED